ncbi:MULTISPECIES: glycosyltransferase family 2 protein, partial [Muribaculaceae]
YINLSFNYFGNFYRIIDITLLKYICYIFVGYKKNQNSRFMRTPKLSIIIPVYNVASYIEESVYSLLNQTVIRDMEIILVENGSKDNSLELCHKLSDCNPCIKVITTDIADVSTARNCGLNIARGSLIGFIDGDDTVEPTMFEELIKAKEAFHADIAYCNFKYVQLDGTVEHRFPDTGAVSEISPSELCYEILMEESTSAPWARIYDRSFFDNRKFPERMVYEDHSTMYRWMSEMSKIVHIDKPLYNYHARIGSITNGFDKDLRKYHDYFYAEIGRLDFVYDYSNLDSVHKKKVLRYLIKNTRVVAAYYVNMLLKNNDIEGARKIYRYYLDILDIRRVLSSPFLIVKTLEGRHKFKHRVSRILESLYLDQAILK